MSEYIDRNKLLKTINENVAEAHNERCAQVLEAILEAPIADVGEVVRCKDCKYSEIDENGNLWCAFYNGKIREMPNGYCWHGERKEE